MKTLSIALGLFCLQSTLSLSATEAFQTVSPDSSDLVASRNNVAQHPNDITALKHHADLCLKDHLEAEAVTAAETAHGLAPKDADAHRLYVTAMARNGQYRDALEAQTTDTSWLTDEPTKKIIEAATLGQQAEEKLKQSPTPAFAEAAALFEQAAAADPENPAVRLTLGWVYIDKLHQPKAAYPHLALAAKYHPDDPNALKLFALACSQTGRERQAVEEFRQASLLKPDDLWIRANLGRSMAKFGRYDEAEKIYMDVLTVDPANADARLGQAELLAWRGHSTASLDILNRLVQENPKNEEALELMADVHRWNWQLTEAKQNYQAVLDMDENNAEAKAGLREARHMGASDFWVNAYRFTDNVDFRRESVGAGTRIHLTDRVYFLAQAAGWRFSDPSIDKVDRADGLGGLEYHWSRWLETSIEGGAFEYKHRKAFAQGQASFKITPKPDNEIFTIVSYNQPFVSSIATVTNNLRQESIGNGLNIKLSRRFSLQNSLQVARISDQNEWVEEKPRLSYRLFDKPATFIRAEYDFLSYKHSSADYWTPIHRHTAAPVLDVSIPLGQSVHLDLDGETPYIFDKRKFGYEVQGGLAFDLFDHIQLKGTYYYSAIPGDQGAWSGHGWLASLQINF